MPSNPSQQVPASILAANAYIAGKNHFDATGDLQGAAVAGATSAVRWWVWGSFLVLWGACLFLYGFGWFMLTHGPEFIESQGVTPAERAASCVTAVVFLLVSGLLGLGVTYNRNVDASLFKRRLAYRVFQPVAFVLSVVPTFVFYALFLIVFWL